MTKRWIPLAGAAALGMLVSGCKPADTHEADVAAIRADEAQWNQDFAARDAAKLTAHYADDAVLMIVGMDAIKGKPAIQTMMQRMAADPAMQVKLEESVVEASGKLGYVQGTYTMAISDPGSKGILHDHGSYVTVYRKGEDGSWKAVSDIATSAVPPAPPSAPSVSLTKP